MKDIGNSRATPIIIPHTNYTYGHMLKDLDMLMDRYPGHFRVDTVARTLDQRKIVDVLLGNTEAYAQIVIQSTIHGREHMNTLLVMAQLEDVLINYDSTSYKGIPYRKLFEQVCFHILPMTNPDGVTLSQMGVKSIRNSRLRQHLYKCYRSDQRSRRTDEKETTYWSHFKANTRGVDLNRNFDSGWEQYQDAPHPSFAGCKGSTPESEIETKAILSVVVRNHATCVISYHSAGDLIYWDYGSKGSVRAGNKKLARLVSNVTGYPMESTLQNQMDAAGCSDYFTLKKGIPALTIENGSGTCPLPIEEFPEIWRRNQHLWPALARFYMP